LRSGASAVSREVHAPVGINDDAYVPLKWIAERIGVGTGTVRHWRYRGWIDHEGKQRHVRVKGRLYNAADVLAAERDTRLSSQSRRSLRPVAA